MKGLVRWLRVRRRLGNYLCKPHCETGWQVQVEERILAFRIERFLKSLLQSV